MKKFFVIALAACTLAPAAQAQEPGTYSKDSAFVVVKANPITSIKDQNQSGTCWAYTSLAFFEAELLRMGKGQHDLCESFLVYHT